MSVYASSPLPTDCRRSCKVLMPTEMQWLYELLAFTRWCALTRRDGMESSAHRMPRMLFVLLSGKAPEDQRLVKGYCINPAFAHWDRILVFAVFVLQIYSSLLLSSSPASAKYVMPGAALLVCLAPFAIAPRGA